MQKLSDQEMSTLIALIGKADTDQLRAAGEAIRRTSDLRHRQATVGISVGSKVKWNGKHGPNSGVVKQVKLKYVLVQEDGKLSRNWNVPAAMLKVVP